MKKFIVLVVLYISAFNAFSEDTISVFVHNKTDMTSYGSYLDTSIFPSGSDTFRKVMMHYTMGCATGGCSDWDYTTSIRAYAFNGQLDTNNNPERERFELGRVITPYGSGLSDDWEYTYTFDVTDFAKLLKDTIPIEAFYSGWSSGFSVSLRFDFIKGTPAREVLNIDNVYNGSWNYIIPDTFNMKYVPEKAYEVNPLASYTEFKFTPTGHGFVNSVNCAEFCEKNYFVSIGGQIVDTQLIWNNECGLNPIFPQGGTWLYDRANWCPGGAAKRYKHDLSSYTIALLDTVDLDVDMEIYYYTVPSGETPANYIIESQFIQYGDYNYYIDAELEDIIAPNRKDNFNRNNPICNNPIVRVRNYGEASLETVTLNYGIGDDLSNEYKWEGLLTFGEYVDITLPRIDFPSAEVSNQSFTAKIISASGGTGGDDEFLDNNAKTSSFDIPDIHDRYMKFDFASNKHGDESIYGLYTQNGDTVFHYDSVGYYNDLGTFVVIYHNSIDTVYLEGGCYELIVEDRGKNGLSFPWGGNGNGYFIMTNSNDSVVHIMEPNFGTKLRYSFFVNNNTGIVKSIQSSTLLYPNPAQTDLNYILPPNSGLKSIEITDLLGKLIIRKQVNDGSFPKLDVSKLNSGMYLVRFNLDQQRSFSKKLYKVK